MLVGEIVVVLSAACRFVIFIWVSVCTFEIHFNVFQTQTQLTQTARLDVSALLCMLLSARALTQGPVVTTTFGALVGKTEGQCDAFLGVPYADPPVGQLRFNNPVDWHKPWNNPRNATSFGAYCIQTVGPATSGSEDCLFLNVWAPHSRGAGLAVMVFLHGGAFNAGSGDQPAPPLSAHNYDGCDLARSHGVIVVSLNYRSGRKARRVALVCA